MENEHVQLANVFAPIRNEGQSHRETPILLDWVFGPQSFQPAGSTFFI